MSRRGNAADDLLSLASMRQKRDSTSLMSTAGLAGWCRDAGFGDIEILALTCFTSAGIAYK
jgi:hypothetical protein